jgi:hypothetical protein
MDTVEEAVSINLCLLLTRCYLMVERPDRAMEVLAFIDKTFLPQPLQSIVASPSSPSNTPTEQLR